MKNRLFAIAITFILLFFFTGTLTFAQSKTDKNDTKTEKQVEQKVEKKDVNNTATTTSLDKNTPNTIASKDRTNEMKRTRHHVQHTLTSTIENKADKAPEKEVNNNKDK